MTTHKDYEPRMLEDVRRWRKTAYDRLVTRTPEQWAARERELIERAGLTPPSAASTPSEPVPSQRRAG
ncbi:MAG: hypothetical protein IT435_20540 [Phycisphaerales bacterium]|nr:hypothetical protein [Phycisphaerales bacterium]